VKEQPALRVWRNRAIQVRSEFFMAAPVPDWQLPRGVSRGLRDYFKDADIASTYDEQLIGSSLVVADQHFAERYFDQPGRLIDLGCGTGRLLVPFARRGYWVLGVDLSAEMLKQAGTRAVTDRVVIHRLRANLVELQGLCDQAFDYAACLFSTLGMIMGQAYRQQVVAHAFRLLRPGGKFVLHVHNRWFSFWDRPGRRWLAGDLLRALVGRSSKGDRLMPVHQGIAGLTLHLFKRREATDLLRRAGFKVLEVIPVGLGAAGQLSCPYILPGLRSYGYLFAAERPASR
jgi:SAM-dependent methyltransferase